MLFLTLRALIMLPNAPNDPRKASIPGSSNPVGPFSGSVSSVFALAACSSKVERLSSIAFPFNSTGSTLDNCKIVMPTQMVRKPMTSVMISLGDAARPLNKMIVVMIEKKVTIDPDE